MGFYFNGYDINGSPLTYNTNYANIMTSWWDNAHNILNGTLTISSNILRGDSTSSFVFANRRGYDTLENLELVLTDLVANDYINLPQFLLAGEKTVNLKDFSYSINNIETGDFRNLRSSIFPQFLIGSWCPNLSNNGVLNVLNLMDEMYLKTNILSWFNTLCRDSSLSDITLKNFTYNLDRDYLTNAFKDAKVTNLTFENFTVLNNVSDNSIRASALFENCQNLRIGSLNENFFSKLDNLHRNITLKYAFERCSNLTEIPDFYNSTIKEAYLTFYSSGIPNFPTYNYLGCNGMTIAANSNITKISNLKYTNNNFTSFYLGFQNCKNLIEISNISLKNIPELGAMFQWTPNLSQINNVRIENVYNGYAIFDNCPNLITINNLIMTNFSKANDCFWCPNLSSFVNSTITQILNMDRFFDGCNNLKTLPNLDFSKTTSANNMFWNCKNLSTDSLNYFGMVLPNRSNLTNISTYNLSYFGLTNDQINIIASNTAARISVQSKGWEIANLAPKRTRVTQVAQMNNNRLENIKIGMDAEYVTLPGGVLNFLPNETNMPTVINEMFNYLNDQINAKYRAFDISFDIYDIGDYDENIGDYQYTFNQHINTRIYSDTSENGENLRNYIEQYTGYNGYNSYYVGNLNIVEISAPNFINAYNMFFGVAMG